MTGVQVFICGGTPAPRCRVPWCGAPSSTTCTFVLGGRREGQPCAAPLCPDHAGPAHLCPPHQRLTERQARKEGSSG